MRVAWIDAVKGLAISLIVMGHVWSLENPPLFYLWLFAFHVPVFFFVSGLTLKPDATALRLFLRQRLIQLMVPYVCYALLGYAFYLLGFMATRHLDTPPSAFDYGLWTPLLGILEGRAGDGRLVNSPLWFLPALLIALVITQTINRQLTHRAAAVIAALGIAGVGLLLAPHLALPMSAVAGLIAVAFIQVGYEYQRAGYPLPKNKAVVGILLLGSAGISLLAPINGAVGLAGPTVNHPLGFMFFAANGIALCLLLARVIPAPLCALLARIGQHSLAILVLHMLLIKSIKVAGAGMFGVSFSEMEHSVLAGCVILAVTALALIPSVLIVERWLPYTLGRWRTRTAR